MIAAVSKAFREHGEYRLGNYGSFLHRFALSPWDWCVGVYKFGQDDSPYWCLKLFCFWIRLWHARTMPKGDMHLDKWGVGLYERSLMLSWGDATKFLYLPWMYDHCRTEVMLSDGTFVVQEKFSDPEPEGIFRQVHPYTYVLKRIYSHDSTDTDSCVQRRKATITVERRSWCWRGWPFSAFRWPRKTSTTISINFDDEVGEKSGSWKGGCIGCGYELKPDETPLECLRRMEKERKF